MSRTYAGIGARSTPSAICTEMSFAASALEDRGYLLRSGAAGGADDAFERGVKSPYMKEIFLPWNGFNGRDIKEPGVLYPYGDQFAKAMEIAKAHHPAWDNLTQGIQRLIARNSFQVLGRNLDDPVDFVLCWTEKGAGKGGTGQAIRVAQAYGIPVFDMGKGNLASIEQELNQILQAKAA